MRFERSLATGAEHRVIVGWKERSRNDPLLTDGVAANDHLVTTRWRDAPVFRSEGAVIGVRYVLEYVADDLVVSHASHWAFQGTGLQNRSRLPGLLGFEVDDMAGQQPPGTDVLCTSVATELPHARNPTIESATAHMTLYTWPSGAGLCHRDDAVELGP